jgi:Putative prokaryotic signal transducing protein
MRGRTMRELLRTNDIVLASAIEALLTEAEVPHQVLDRDLSVIQGSLSAVPIRIVVADSYLPEARQLLHDAGLGRELPPYKI